MTLNVDTELREGLTTLAVTGAVDLHSCEHLRKALATHIEEEEPVLGLDLSRVEFMDSNGVVVLMDALSRLRARGRRLVLLGISERVARLLGLLRLKDFFETP